MSHFPLLHSSDLGPRAPLPPPSLSWSAQARILRFGIPQVLSAVLLIVIELINLYFISRQGDSRILGAVGLGNLILNCSCISIGYGLNAGLDTLASQSYGKQDHRLSGVYLNRAQVVVSLAAVVLISFLQFTEPLLLALRQEPETSALAALYVRRCAWGAPGAFYASCFRKIFTAYRMPGVNAVAYVVLLPLHFTLCYIFVECFGWGLQGTASALVCTWWVWFFLLLGYAQIAKPFPPGVIKLPFRRSAWDFLGWKSYLSVAIPSLVMICLDWWSFEFGAFIVGLLHSPPQLAAHVSACNIVNFIYMSYFGLNQAIAALTGNAIGAGDVAHAQELSLNGSAIGLSVGVLWTLAMFFLRQYIAGVYTEHQPLEVREILSNIMFYMGLYLIFVSSEVMLFGVAKGLGLQRQAALATLFSSYGIMLPVGALICLGTSWGVYGFWIGLGCGEIVTTVVLGWIVWRANWFAIAKKAHERMERDALVGRSESAC